MFYVVKALQLNHRYYMKSVKHGNFREGEGNR